MEKIDQIYETNIAGEFNQEEHDAFIYEGIIECHRYAREDGPNLGKGYEDRHG